MQATDQWIYLDYMASTPVDSEATAAMLHCLSHVSGNPSSTHRFGLMASGCVETAREQVAAAIGSEPEEIVWTSGATESNNLAIQGACRFYQRQGRHVITMATEHKSVREVFRFLSAHGFRVTYLKPEPDGLLNIEQLKMAVQEDTILVSIMHVNNETGVVQNLSTIASLLQPKGIIFHVDAAQSIGKARLDVRTVPIDLVSLSGHKTYGPKGVGALYVRKKPGIHLQPLCFGGDQELGLRPGTVPVHQVVGMGIAFRNALHNFESELARITHLKNVFWEEVRNLKDVHVHGSPSHRVPHCLNLYFEGVDSEALRFALWNIAFSSGAACDAIRMDPSPTLLAMGVNRYTAVQSLRFSLGRYTTHLELERTACALKEHVNRLRRTAPIH